MGGRGGAGVKKSGTNSSKKPSKPSYFAETEKAVKLKIRVEDIDLDQEKTRLVWVPKSQLADDGRPGDWITGQKAKEFYSWNRSTSQYHVIWEDASGEKFESSMTAKEKVYAEKEKVWIEEKIKRLKASEESYKALVDEAKSMGIKGVRIGWKRKTIEKRIAEQKKQKR